MSQLPPSPLDKNIQHFRVTVPLVPETRVIDSFREAMRTLGGADVRVQPEGRGVRLHVQIPTASITAAREAVGSIFTVATSRYMTDALEIADERASGTEVPPITKEMTDQAVKILGALASTPEFNPNMIRPVLRNGKPAYALGLITLTDDSKLNLTWAEAWNDFLVELAILVELASDVDALFT